MSRRIVLYSPHDPVSLATRLKAVLGDRGDRPKKPKKGVSGEGSDVEMMLFVRRASGAVSATRFNAVIDPEGGGAKIDGRFSAARGLGCGLIVWCAFLSIFVVTGYFITTGGGALEVGIPFMVIPGAMMVVPIALWWFGARSSASDEAEILAFLDDTVSARPR